MRELIRKFERIVIVNDGSSRGLEYFREVEPLVEKVIVHPVNRGKGAALKTGFDYLKDVNVITADADGQHTPRDIVRIARALEQINDGIVLGVRAFDGKVPLRSRFGNWWTRVWFFVLTGLWVKDTQTGLRGIPAPMIERVRALEGERYEYEMVMLADAKHHATKPVQIPIETIYLNDNRESHFSPMRDTVRIYRALFRYLCK